MKYLIASDIHGSFVSTEKILERAKQFDVNKIIFLGDIYYHGPRNNIPDYYDPKKVAELLNENVEKLVVLKGNCDGEVDQMISSFDFVESAILTIGNKTFFLTHGHKYNQDNLPKGKFDGIIFGHFHTGYIKKEKEVILANCGSVTLPKNNTKKSFLILDEEKLTLYDLDNNKLEELAF